MLGELVLFKLISFNSRELSELEDLLCSLIYPIKNALMNQIALKSAYRDPLTSLNNRTAMEKNLPREIDLAKRHSQARALLMMDLDGFKEINDVIAADDSPVASNLARERVFNLVIIDFKGKPVFMLSA